MANPIDQTFSHQDELVLIPDSPSPPPQLIPTMANPIYQVFEYQDELVLIIGSVFENPISYILKPQIESHFGVVFDSRHFAFYCQGYSVYFDRHPSTLEIILPERLRCREGTIKICQVPTPDPSVTSTSPSMTSHQITDIVPPYFLGLTELSAATASVPMGPNIEHSHHQEQQQDERQQDEQQQDEQQQDEQQQDEQQQNQQQPDQQQQDQQQQNQQQPYRQQDQHTLLPGPQTHSKNMPAIREAMTSFRAQPIELRKRVLLYNKAEEFLSFQQEIQDSESPRLFIFLPDPEMEWDAGNPLKNTFLLYFLCECGRDSLGTSTHICFDKATNHKVKESDQGSGSGGFLIHHPLEFFKQYGPMLLILLESLRLGLVVAGFSFESLDLTEQIPLLTKVEQAIDTLHVFRRHEKLLNGAQEFLDTYQDLNEYLKEVQSVKLDKIYQNEFFQGRNYVEQMFRIKVGKGYARWVCEKHYNMMTKDLMKDVKRVMELTTGSEGGFIKQIGRLVASSSTKVVKKLYESSVKLSGIQDLDLTLNWNQEQVDLFNVQALVEQCQPSTLRLNLKSHVKSDDDDDGNESYTELLDPLLSILKCSSLRHVWFCGLKGFWTKSAREVSESFTGFEHLKSLRISSTLLVKSVGLNKIKDLLTCTRNLKRVQFLVESKKIVALFNAVCKSRKAGHCELDVAFEGSRGKVWLCIRLPRATQWKHTEDYQSLKGILGHHGSRIIELMVEDLCFENLATLEDATVENSILTALSADFSSMDLIQLGVMGNLIKLPSLKRVEGTFASDISLLKCIPWKHLTTLALAFKGSDVTKVFRLLFEGFSRAQVESIPTLTRFAVLVREDFPEISESIVCDFLGLLSVKVLVLELSVLAQLWEKILEAIDYSKLDTLALSPTKDTDYNALDALSHMPQKGFLLARLCINNIDLDQSLIQSFKDRQIVLAPAQSFEQTVAEWWQ